MKLNKETIETDHSEFLVEALYEILEKCLERLERMEAQVEEHTQQLKYLRH